MIKKVGLCVLSAMMGLSLAACSGKTEPGAAPKGAETANQAVEGDELKPEAGAKLLVWEGKEQIPFLQEMAQQFEQKYNVKVEVQEVNSPDQMGRLRTDGPAGTGADVLVMPHDHLGEAVAAGIVLPNDIHEDESKQNFMKASVDGVTMDGVVYGYPRNMETYALFYNKDLVKDAPLNTWDDVKNLAKQYNDVSNNKFGFMYEANNWYYNYAFIAGFGGYVFGKHNTDPSDIGINSPGAVEGMKFYQSLREILPIKATDATNDVKTALFQEGKLPLNMDGVWNIGNFSKLPFKVGVVPLPKLPNGKEPVPFAGIKAYYVSSYTKFPNAAKLFAHYVTSKEALLKDYEMSGIIPARNDMEEEPAIKNNEMVQGFLKQFKNVQPMPAIIEMRQVWGPATASLELIWNGGDVKEILDKAVKDIKTGIASQGK